MNEKRALRTIRSTLLATVISVPFLAPGIALGQDIQTRLTEMSGAIAQGATEGPAGATLRATTFLPAFYAARENRPAWEDEANLSALLAGIEAAIAQGYRAEDFQLDVLTTLVDAVESGDEAARADLDVLATDSAARLLHHMIYGKVDPSTLDADWNFERPVMEADPVEVVNTYLDGEGFAALLERLALNNPQYVAMTDALARYRAIAAAGGWPVIAEGETLKPDMVDPRVATLRTRLEAEGALSAPLPAAAEGATVSDPSHVYSPALVQDVQAFQTRHGLEADGLIGPGTLLVLNRTVEERIDQLRLSLERARWIARGLGDDYVLVNIAAPKTYLRLNGTTVWETRSITGTPYRKTPVFRDEIEFMEVNPTWTVPQGIFRADKLPAIRNDIGYIERGGYSVRRLSDGQTVAASSVDWSSDNPGVTLVQEPGPDNALGLIKFMFPNDYAVYLHDTNDRSLFDRNDRNLSSGCIRIENPFELANLLLEEDPEWSPERLEQVLASGETTRIPLATPLPVMLTYWTAWVEDGQVQFREDVYERDAAVLSALNAEL